jgi:hypothetical protein
MNEDDDILGDYLIEEESDITHVLLPKLNIDLERTFDDYYKLLKKCRNKGQILTVLQEFYVYINTISVLSHEIGHLQDRAQELEIMMLGLDSR